MAIKTAALPALNETITGYAAACVLIGVEPTCPHCAAILSSKQGAVIASGRKTKCSACQKKMNWKTGTIWAGSHAGMTQALAFLYAHALGANIEKKALAASVSVDAAARWTRKIELLGGQL